MVVTYVWCAVIDLIQALVLRFHWLIDLLCLLTLEGEREWNDRYIYMQLQYRLAKFREFWNARQSYGTRTQNSKNKKGTCFFFSYRKKKFLLFFFDFFFFFFLMVLFVIIDLIVILHLFLLLTYLYQFLCILYILVFQFSITSTFSLFLWLEFIWVNN